MFRNGFAVPGSSLSRSERELLEISKRRLRRLFEISYKSLEIRVRNLKTLVRPWLEEPRPSEFFLPEGQKEFA